MSGPLRLCYVDGEWAYFSTGRPGDVWGDDWNDAPHDCNAGTPYAERAPGLTKVAYDGDLRIVGEGAFGGYVYERWGWLSAEQINQGQAPWLVRLAYGDPVTHDLEISAGATLEEFRALVVLAGGCVYEAVAS